LRNSYKADSIKAVGDARAALEDSKKQTRSTLIDIKVLTRTKKPISLRQDYINKDLSSFDVSLACYWI